VNSAGEILNYTYATNASGQTTSKGIAMVLQTNYYQHTVSYDTNNCKSTVTYTRGSTNLVYNYYYNAITQKITRIEGASSSNQYKRFEYSAYGDMTRSVEADSSISASNIIQRSYDSWHNVTNEAFGYCATPSNKWAYTWDTNMSVLASSTDPEGNKTEMEYTNALVSKIKSYYAATNYYETVFAYTTNGLLSSATNANGHYVNFYHDDYGNVTSAVPQEGISVYFSYNALNQLTSMYRYSGNYDTNGNPIVITNAFDVNELGWIKKITYPNEQYESFLYDNIGNVTNHVDVGGRTTKYEYLPTRKLSAVKRVLPSGAVITNRYEYDNQFNTLTIRDGLDRKVEAYLLDAQDRIYSVTNLEGQTMSISYGIGSYANRITRFDGTIVSNQFNSDGLISKTIYPETTNSMTYYKNGLDLSRQQMSAVQALV
jgi:YD repeat-containing protein